MHYNKVIKQLLRKILNDHNGNIIADHTNGLSNIIYDNFIYTNVDFYFNKHRYYLMIHDQIYLSLKMYDKLAYDKLAYDFDESLMTEVEISIKMRNLLLHKICKVIYDLYQGD